MRVWILHQSIPSDATPDERDVLVQVETVGQSLVRLGHRVEVGSCTLDLASLDTALSRVQCDLVFNLVEAVAGAGRLLYMPPALMDARQRPYTGNPAEVLFLTSHKILAKERLRETDLPTPLWMTIGSHDARTRSSDTREGRTPTAGGRRRTWLIKSVWEHASLGMDDSCLIHGATPNMAANRLSSFSERMGGECFAEEFIDGREFNVGILAGPNGPETLPPAEIVFSDFPADKPRIVGYQAKWAPDSFEFKHTLRRFDFESGDTPLLEDMKRLALQCWDAFGLAGYARVDFRVDAEGNPWILEINSNPCLSPDAGFAAAAERAGISFDQVVARILADALNRSTLLRRPSSGRRKSTSPRAEPERQEAPAATPTPPAQAAPHHHFTFRHEVVAADCDRVRTLIQSTEFFHAGEADVAVELVEERLKKGAASGYEFVMAEDEQGRLLGYTCFGPIPCTVTSYDLYWIAVHPEAQGNGFGRKLNAETERRVRELGGTRIYAETSTRAQYFSTRAFYERMGYTLAEQLDDFYAPGDGRATYVKVLSAPAQS